jgi:Cu/Ag efflux protein CusF
MQTRADRLSAADAITHSEDTMISSSLRAVIMGFAIALLASACGGSATANEGDGIGVVRALGAGGKTITLEHGDLPGLMRAMTMEFAVAEPAQLAGVEVGETVAFHLVYEDGAYTITELREQPAQ